MTDVVATIEEPIADLVDEPVLDEVGDVGEETEGEEESTEAPAKPDEEDVPERYRGKSKSEIIKMHEDAGRTITAQGKELEGWRKQLGQEPEVLPEDTERKEIEREAYESLTLWESEQKLNLRLQQGLTAEEATEQVEALRNERWQLEWAKANKEYRTREDRRKGELRTQLPTILSNAVEKVAREIPGLAQVSLEEVGTIIAGDSGALDTFLSASQSNREMLIQNVMIYALGMKVASGGGGTNTALDEQEEVTSKAPAMLRRSTAGGKGATAYKDDPTYKVIYRQQRAFSNLDPTIPEEAARLERMATNIYKAQKGGG